MAARSGTRPRNTGQPNPRRAKVTEQPTPFLRRRSTRILGIALALALIAGIAGVLYLSRGPQTVTADQAVEAFRTAPEPKAEARTTSQPTGPKPVTAPVAGAPQQPQQPAAQPPNYGPLVEGVYVFATKGYEETDAFAGQRHTYPSETAMTIRKDGCGWIARWEPLRERWEETEMCEKAEGTEMGRYTMYHEFFRRGVREDFACPGSFVQKPSAKPGDAWTFECTSQQSKVAAKVTVVGFEDMNVGGQVVKTVHYHYDIKVSGANSGTLVQDRWLSNSPRVMTRLTQKADMQVASPFGKVGYKEDYRIDLKSVEPRT